MWEVCSFLRGWTMPVFAIAVSVYPMAAQLVLCNAEPDAVGAAVGLQYTTGDIATAGWITIHRDECRTVLAKALDFPAVYVYASDSYGNQLDAPDSRKTFDVGYEVLCTKPIPFRLNDARSCPAADAGLSQRFLRIRADSRSRIVVTLRRSPDDSALSTFANNVLPDTPSLARIAPASNPTPFALTQLAGHLRQRTEALIPLIDESEWRDIGDGVMVRYHVWRDPIHLSALGSNTLIGSVRLYYAVEGGVHRPWQKGSQSVSKLGSCGTVDPRVVDVSFKTVVTPVQGGQSVYMKTAITRVALINKCQPTFVHFDVSARIRAVLETELASVAAALDAALSNVAPEAPSDQATLYK